MRLREHLPKALVSLSRCAGASLAALATLAVVSAAADAGWFYTLHEERADQQANLCWDRQELLRIATVFENEGPKPGYEELTESEACTTRVDTFTPEVIVTQVVISTGYGDDYVVSFVQIRTAAGERQYLVTTRQVVP